MGGRGAYDPRGGFTKQDYHHNRRVGRIKVVEKINGGSGLPQYSNTRNTRYWGVDKNGNINQLRIFRNRQAVIDIDFPHSNAKGVAAKIHAHLWVNGERQDEHRKLSVASEKRYKKLLDLAIRDNKARSGK